MRAVYDTNVIVSGLISEMGAPGRLLEAWSEKAVVVVCSQPLKRELEEVLGRPDVRRRVRWSDESIAMFINLYWASSMKVNPRMSARGVSPDPDDAAVLEAATEGQADYIVTGDRDLLDLGSYRGIRIVTPAVFLAILAAEKKYPRA